MNTKINVIIPLGGFGERFSNNNYTKPKPLVNALGSPILYWLLNNIDLNKVESLLIPYNRRLIDYRFESQLKKDFPKVKFIFMALERDTKGACETLYKALEVLQKDVPVLCVDGDNFFLEDIIEPWNLEDCIYVFEDYSKEPIYSYSKIEETKISGGLKSYHIVDIVEKEKISDWASAGIYGFKSSGELKKYCNKIIKNNIKQKNEFYISTIFKEMIKDKCDVKPKFLRKENIVSLGTPTQLRIFCENKNIITNKSNLKRFCFDLDNTLVTYPSIDGDYTTVKPIEKNINLVKELKKLGHEIIIYTARRMKTHKGNVGKIIKDIGYTTIETLKLFGIPYDELHFGKPQADFYIDDLAVSAFSNLEKELGFYFSSTQPRAFNKISTHKIDVIKKTSQKDLSGEIYYYQNIPKQIKDLFPSMINFCDNNSFYEIEKVEGLTASSLFVSENLTEKQLIKIIDSIKRIHMVDFLFDDDTINIYENYSKKINKRYNEYDYSGLEDSASVFQSINNFLIDYENKKMGKICVIHGDPVLTNIIIDVFGGIKFIDMRGKLGEKTTILGDSLYDWAKLYQSIIGYDEVLEEKFVSTDYKNHLKKIFEEKFLEEHSELDFFNLKNITKSLLFSLIPIHNNYKNKDFWSLINNV